MALAPLSESLAAQLRAMGFQTPSIGDAVLAGLLPSSALADSGSPTSAPAPAAAAPSGGWRRGQKTQPSGEETLDWLWEPTLSASEGYWDFNDGASNYVAPPPDSTGMLEFRADTGENPSGGGWFDAGSGLQVLDRLQINAFDEAQRAAFDARLPNLTALPKDAQWELLQLIHRGVGTGAIKRMADLGRFSPEFTSDIGPWLAARQAEDDDRRGFDSHIMDSINTELTHFENVGESWQEDPERAFLGINTPLETELWGALTGKEYDENTNMWGSPTKADYQESAARGNDPGFAAWSHAATEAILGGMFGAKVGATEFGQTTQGQAAIAAARTGAEGLNAGEDPWRNVLAAILASLAQTGVELPAGDTSTAAGGAERLQFADAGPTSDVGPQGMLSSGDAELDLANNALGQKIAFDLSGVGKMPPAQAEEGDPTAPPAETTAPPPSDNSARQTIARIARVANVVRELLADEDDQPEDAPQQGELSDEEYAQQLGEYVGVDLSNETMTELGLQPGTQAYYEHILEAAEGVIAEVLGDLDVDAADFAQQLRAKTDAELVQLQRALYVRGQLGTLVGSGSYEDPTTGGAESISGPGMFNPGVGAYQRGLARNVSHLAGLRGEDALGYLDTFLGRQPDFYGMQESADARYQEALKDDENIRKRGMFGSSY
jgi:hypothetical protein